MTEPGGGKDMPIDVKFAQAKEDAERNGKEPFDYEKFVSLYLHDTGDCKQLTGNESEDVKLEYEREYYVWYPELKTVAEFAEFLNKIDETS